MEAIKLELTKYVKRERRKALPPEVDFWDFLCRVGSDSGSAAEIPLPEIPKAVDAVVLAGGAEVYVEILARPGYRVKKPFSESYNRREA